MNSMNSMNSIILTTSLGQRHSIINAGLVHLDDDNFNSFHNLQNKIVSQVAFCHL
jgi:hypothetical protein